MSEFRISFSGKGIGNAIQTRQEEKFTHLIAGDSDICAWRVSADDDMLCFEVGHSFGCSAEFDEFVYNVTKCLPDTPINYYWHSTMSGMSGSYNIGFMDGKFKKWEDDEVYPDCEFRIIHKGIGSLLECGDKDAAGFTRVRVNGREFWLNDLHIEDDCIQFNNAVKSSRSYEGIDEELTKAVPDREVTIEDEYYLTGDVAVYKATYKNGEYDKQFLDWA